MFLFSGGGKSLFMMSPLFLRFFCVATNSKSDGHKVIDDFLVLHFDIHTHRHVKISVDARPFARGISKKNSFLRYRAEVIH